MTFRRSQLAILIGAVTLMGVTLSPGLAEAVTVKNSSNYVGAGRWNWTIYLEADSRTLQQIECVEYTLHPTFPNPVRKVCNEPETKFAYSTNGWGTFTVKVDIQYKNGRHEELKHMLVFERQPASPSVSLTAKNWAREIEPGWWEWGIYIEGAPTELDRIRCVEYTLHPTFPNPVRMVCSRQNRFELTTRGWGTFTVKIKVILKDGSLVQLSHLLEFG